MRKIIFTICAITAMAMGADMPICEEYEGEPNVSCVTGDNRAVLITQHADGSRSYEYFKDNRKIYLEIGENYVYASDGKRKIDVSPIPNNDHVAYIDELFYGLIDSLDF
jgi:hypothetical protein